VLHVIKDVFGLFYESSRRFAVMKHTPAMQRGLLVAAAIGLALVAIFTRSTVTGAATTITDNISIPISYITYAYCPGGGAGEYIQLSGTLHYLTHTTFDNKGGAHIVFHSNYQGVTGVGLTTGTKYRATGGSHYTYTTRGLPFTTTSTSNFGLIGQGRDNKFTFHYNFHITVNANGELTATVSNFRVRCKPDNPYPGPTTPTPTPHPYPGPTTPTPTNGPYPGPTTPTPTYSPYPGPTGTPIARRR
jgi:hypothetical protein